jgi:4-hydroxythreonine-4-phosphate dehydrogenase
MSKHAEGGTPAPILITMGEPSGIGPEVAAAAWQMLGGHIAGRALRLVGDRSVFRRFGEYPDEVFWPADGPGSPGTAGVPPAGLQSENSAGPGEAKKRPAERRGSHEQLAVVAALDIAVRAALAGEAAAIVTAPVHKAKLLDAGFPFAGHTEYLAERTGAPRAVMMLMGAGLRVVPLTIHIPLAEVPAAISQHAIVETAEIVLQSLARDFAIPHPRLAVTGLNPHAGESGKLGREDGDIIAPAVAALRARGHLVKGPLPADTMFHEAARAQYDAALCMYHDQALIPLKTLAFWDGVNVTLGLPIIRTSPDHGTACDIAGKGIADPRSMLAAIRLAAEMAQARGH